MAKKAVAYVYHTCAASPQEYPPSSSMLRLTLGEYERILEGAGDRTDLGPMKPAPHKNRHGGASNDFLRRARDEAGVQERGKWLSRTSVRRYKKTGKMLRQWEKVGASVRDRCMLSEAYLLNKFS